MASTLASPKILVIDDDVRICDLLRRYLEQQNLTVTTINDVAELDAALQASSPDLIVLDLMMPREDGMSVCKRLRTTGNATPIIMLTARHEDQDRIAGLEAGADDYLAKPFNPRELLARIHAVLRRRSTSLAQYVDPLRNDVVVFGPYRLDIGLRSLTRDGQYVTLTTSEFTMLSILAQHPGKPLSREQLAQLTRGRSFEPFDRSLDVQISRLRKLLEEDPARPRFIQTVWGMGYVFVPGPSAPAV